MRRRNLAACVATILCALSFIVVGSTFSNFFYMREIISVKNPKLVLSEGMEVFSSKGDKAVDSLTLSKMQLGLKPATGDEDVETGIPSTVHEKKGSEGQFAKVKVFLPKGARVAVRDIKIDSKQKPEEVEKERENIFVAISELKEKAKPLQGEEVVLGDIEASDERKEITFLVWLSAKAGEALKGSTISFNVYFLPLS